MKENNTFNSKEYWSGRYDEGGNSGPGSRGILASYKASIVNRVIQENNINEVLELGSGDGYQCQFFTVSKYTGLDVSKKAIDLCNAKYCNKKEWNFYNMSDDEAKSVEADLTLSLDVIFHLIEDNVYEEYMEKLFDSSRKYVLIYSSNVETQSSADHVKHRKYTEWVETNKPNFKIIEEMDNPYPYAPNSDITKTSFSSFKLFEMEENS